MLPRRERGERRHRGAGALVLRDRPQPAGRRRQPTVARAAAGQRDRLHDGLVLRRRALRHRLRGREARRRPVRRPLFAFLSTHDFRAHARVKIFKLESSNRLLPIAVPTRSPRAARVMYVDESTGTVLASSSLTRNGTQNGLAIWDTPDVAVPITAAARRRARRPVRRSGHDDLRPDLRQLLRPDLGHARIVHLRGWTAAGTATAQAPIARNVSLVPGSCPDATFVNAAVSCTIGVNATVDFGVANPVTTLGATVSATVAGTNYPLTYNAGTGVWSANAAIPVPPAGGPRDVALHWQITKLANGSNCNGNSCRGDITQVHRTFSALAGQLRADRARAGHRGRRHDEQLPALQRAARHLHAQPEVHDRYRAPGSSSPPRRPAGPAARDRRQPEPVARLRPREART